MKRKLLRCLLRNRVTRAVLNVAYNMLSYQKRADFIGYADVFSIGEIINRRELYSFWRVEFMGNLIRMPMSNWPQALTIAAYDPEIVEFYEWVITDRMVDVFVDIGANCGTHSFLFASQGIRAIAVEPNHWCARFIGSVCEHNNFWFMKPEILEFAVGDKAEITFLFFPPEKSWLGIVGENREKAFEHKIASDPSCPKLKRDDPMTREQVRLIRLDDSELFRYGRPKKTLLKIDVEGMEFEVLSGGITFIATFRPIILFECFDSQVNRECIYRLLGSLNYRIFPLPFNPLVCFSEESRFVTSAGTNFVACPNDRNFTSKVL